MSDLIRVIPTGDDPVHMYYGAIFVRAEAPEGGFRTLRDVYVQRMIRRGELVEVTPEWQPGMPPDGPVAAADEETAR